jgi:HlyD family secretion protein
MLRGDRFRRWNGLMTTPVYSRAPARPGRSWVVVLVGLAALGAGVAAGVYFGGRPSSPNGRHPDAGGTDPNPPARVTALGRIQPAGGVVPVYGPPGDRIDEMKPLTPGTPLKAGAPIATLASREQRAGDVKVAEVQLAEAKAALKASLEAGQKKIDAARAEVNQLAAGEKNDLAALDAKVELVRKQKATAAKQVERLEGLKADRVRIADEDLEKARLLVDQADAELTAATATRRKTATAYVENKKAADARVAAATAELAEAEARAPIRSSEERLTQAKKALELTTITAPIDGVVLKVSGHTGQPTGMEPILQMASLGAMTVVAEVYESDVERVSGWVKAGPVTADVTNPALPRPLKGTVRSEADVSRMIARNQVFAVGPREDADRRVVEVVAHLDAEASAVAARFVGLQVTVTLSPGK